MRKEAVDIKEGCCPHCGMHIDAATGLTGEHTPSPGDVSVCLYCTGYVFFNDDLSLRKMTDEEFVALDLSLRSLLASVRRTLQLREQSS